MASSVYASEGDGALVTRVGDGNWLVCRFYTRSVSMRRVRAEYTGLGYLYGSSRYEVEISGTPTNERYCQPGLAERLALAVLQGDKVAQLALVDLILESR